MTTDASGVATVCIASTNAGLATLSASTSTATVAQRPIEFVATDADSMNLQASPNTVTAGGQSTITAVVRDPSNNLVKSKAVVFTLTDVTGGTLSVGSAVTDSQGRAQTIYTASSTTSASNGVVINATVQGTSVSGSTSLTVARRELFISLGTGNEIEEPNPAQYVIPYLIIVTDANGVGVANVDLTVRVNSLWYGTGVLDFNTTWQVGTPFNPYVDVCMDEDLILGAGGPEYRNGILDAGEDQNFNGTLEAGNIAAVRPRALEDGDPRPTTITTNADGLAMIDVVYPQEYAYWVKVELSASTAVQGTESARTVSFSLPGAADDYSTETTSPPGLVSPFGIADYSCSDPDTFP